MRKALIEARKKHLLDYTELELIPLSVSASKKRRASSESRLPPGRRGDALAEDAAAADEGDVAADTAAEDEPEAEESGAKAGAKKVGVLYT